MPTTPRRFYPPPCFPPASRGTACPLAARPRTPRASRPGTNRGHGQLRREQAPVTVLPSTDLAPRGGCSGGGRSGGGRTSAIRIRVTSKRLGGRKLPRNEACWQPFFLRWYGVPLIAGEELKRLTSEFDDWTDTFCRRKTQLARGTNLLVQEVHRAKPCIVSTYNLSPPPSRSGSAGEGDGSWEAPSWRRGARDTRSFRRESFASDCLLLRR